MLIYHSCSYPLLLESERQGNVFVGQFYDAKVKDHAEKVSNCPCCGEQLGKVSKAMNLALNQFPLAVNA
jgi:hypothetical protein